MKKIEYKEMLELSIKAKEFVKQIFIDNGYLIYEEKNVLITQFDFTAEKNNKKYAIEVKRGSLDSGKIRASIQWLIETTQKEKYIPILVIIGKNVYKEKLEKEYKINIIDISNLLYLVSDDLNMRDRLISLLDFSTENIEEKSIDFDIDLKKYSNKNNVKYGYDERLDLTPCGKINAQKYENICVDILKYLFNDTLSLWEVQKKSSDDLYRFDLICKIKNDIDSDFFNTIEKYFLSKYIIFEFKNYTKKITQKEIYTTEKYLYKTALRTVAIVITRKGIDTNGMKAVKGILRENGKLIIVLDDNDIKQMILAKEHREDYFEILTNKLDNLLVTLEK